MACAIPFTEYRWPNGIIFYVINPNVTAIDVIYDAMNFWENDTNIRFVPRTNETDYTEFITNAALGYNRSAIGRKGGRQTIELVPQPGYGSLLHELGHTIGLLHEQNRNDAAKYVTPQWDNIQPGREDDFSPSTYQTINSEIYDYASIMHYDAYGTEAKAIDTSIPVIVPVDPDIPLALLGSNTVPDEIDIAMVNYIYPSQTVFIRRPVSNNSAGEVHSIASLRWRRSKLITAVRTGNDNLRLILWSVNIAEGISRLTPANDEGGIAGEAGSIHIARCGDTIVTALQNGSGNLFLISWGLNDNRFTRRGSSGTSAGEASHIKIISLSGSAALTACCNGDGNLLLILWSIDEAGKISRMADSGGQAGEVSEISMTMLSERNSQHIVATTVKAGNDNIKVITWAVSLSDNTITRRADSGSQVREGTGLASAVDRYGHLIVSCKNDSDNLFLISFSVTASGRTITRLADSGSLAGEISLNSLVRRGNGLVSGVSDADDNLKLIRWKTGAGGKFTRQGDSGSQAGTIKLIDLHHLPDNPRAPLCTAVKNDDDNLLLIFWDEILQHGDPGR